MREQLIHVLTEAAEIEHNLLCSYLYAAFSLKRGVEEGVSATEAAAVTRWRKSVMRVALEEMAHLALVNNLLVCVGGASHFNRPNFPVPPGDHPAGFTVRLTPFDADTLEHFLYLERPAASCRRSTPESSVAPRTIRSRLRLTSSTAASGVDIAPFRPHIPSMWMVYGWHMDG